MSFFFLSINNRILFNFDIIRRLGCLKIVNARTAYVLIPPPPKETGILSQKIFLFGNSGVHREIIFCPSFSKHSKQSLESFLIRCLIN